MKFFDKLGLAIFSVIVLILSIILCLIGFNLMDPTIFTILIDKVLMSQTYTNVMIGVCIALLLLAIKCIFFSSVDNVEESKDGILLQNQDGKLLITVETLKNMVEGTIREFANVTDAKVNVIITKENEVIINASLDVVKGSVIKDISSKLQTRIKKSVKEATDLDIKYVNIEVINAEIESNASNVETKENSKEVKSKDTKNVKETKEKSTKKEEVKKEDIKEEK